MILALATGIVGGGILGAIVVVAIVGHHRVTVLPPLERCVWCGGSGRRPHGPRP